MADHHKHRAEGNIESALRLAAQGDPDAQVFALCAIANAILSTQDKPSSSGYVLGPDWPWPTREGGENV